MKWYWLSFVINDVNQGCCNVQAENAEDALRKTHLLGINPGGEVMIYEIENAEVEPDKLISRAELIKLGYISLKDKGISDVEPLEAVFVCPDCNGDVKCTTHN